jgi:serine phosphatase RsbU (regulator of sigma subunit)/anti-sigma regulatory factor (Ser/Thr protein kinase)
MRSAQVSFRVASLDDINAVVDAKWTELQKFCPERVLSRQTQVDIKTAVHEAVANAAKHGGEIERHGAVVGRLFIDHRHIGFEVEDHGPGFNIEDVPVPDLFDMKASGRGVFIMKQVGDELRYKRGKARNLLTFKRFLVGQNASTREIDLLYNISEAVIRGVGLYEICQMILDQALSIFHVERASILVYDEKIGRLKVIASRGLSGEVREKTLVRSGEGVSGYVFRHGRPLLIEDIDENRRGIEKKSGYKSRSFISAPMICSPLRIGEKPLGVINLTDRVDGKKFTKKDLTVLSTIANQAMACLYIRDLMGEVKEKDKLRQELEIVRNIQSSYLPRQAPQIEGFDIAGTCGMATAVGGDYYDYYRVNRWLYLVVADVSGHDMKSAMTMFNFRSQLKVLFSQQQEPAAILTHLNFTMYDDLVPSAHFVSALVIRIDAATGEYVLASAGHYPPLFFNGRYEILDSGLPLGIERREVYRDVTGRLARGDGFLLFTDGVVEAMNAKGKFFGIEHLRGVASEVQGERCDRIVARVVESVRAYRSGNAAQDDITVVALKHD